MGQKVNYRNKFESKYVENAKVSVNNGQVKPFEQK